MFNQNNDVDDNRRDEQAITDDNTRHAALIFWNHKKAQEKADNLGKDLERFMMENELNEELYHHLVNKK